MIKMKHIKIFAIMLVMILLVSNISFGEDKVSGSFDADNPENTRYFYDSKYHSERPRKQAFSEITKKDEKWNLVQYNEQGQQINSYTSDEAKSPEKPGDWTQTGGMEWIDSNHDGTVGDEDKQIFVTYGLPGYVDESGYVDSKGNFYASGTGAFEGTKYNPETHTFIPRNNDDIRIDLDDKDAYADTNRDGKIVTGEIGPNVDRVISSEVIQSDGTRNLEHYHAETGRILLDDSPKNVREGQMWLDGNGRVWDSRFFSEESNKIGINIEFYKDGSFNYQKDVPGINPTRMVIGGNIVEIKDQSREDWTPADITSDGEGGYYIDIDYGRNEYDFAFGDYIPRGETPVHYVAQADGSYVGVIDRAGSDIIFSASPRDVYLVTDKGAADTFTIVSDVTVTDPDTGEHRFVVQDADGNLYEVAGNDDLGKLLINPGAYKIDDKKMEKYFGGQSRFYFGIYRLGVQLDDFKTVVQGYPGFSMFYDPDTYDDWLGVLDNQFVRDLFGGMDKWGETLFCREHATDITGSNTATGAEPDSAAATITAEEYRIPDPTAPTKTQYLYMLEFYVYAGETPAGYPRIGCTDLHFQVLKQGVSLFKNDATGAAYTWELEEGDAIAYTADAMWFGVGTTTHIDEEVCIKFTEMTPNGCIPGINEGETICDTITLAAEETYDFECDGWYCKDFIGFITGAPGREGWSFPTQEGSTDIAGDPTPTGDTTDPNSGQPVLNFG